MTISICIPVYKNVQYLHRLLLSALSQKFNDFEIVITDDSPDNSVQQWLAENFADHRIKYYRNQKALGTPENWNEGIRRSQGEWIKLMHDDDWFESDDALQLYLDHAKRHHAKVVFAAYHNHFLNSGSRELVERPAGRWLLVKHNPIALYARNIVGPPSVIMVHRTVPSFYDKNLKWLVDIDYYIGIMKSFPFVYVKEPLIAVGLGQEQVTVGCHTVPEVEIPEGLHLLSKLGGKPWRNILFFDAWWRLIRNLGIREKEQFEKFSNGIKVPFFIERIILNQSRIAPRILRNGYFSKLMMSRCWVYCFFKSI